MTMRQFSSAPRRRIAALLALALLVPVLLLSFDLPGGSEAAQAAGRTITVTPSAGLAAGQVVTVAWSGFTPNAPVYLHQCVNDTTLWRDCAEYTRLVASSDAAGNGSTPYTVWGGEIPRPAGIVGANGPITCTGGTCMLTVSECGFDLFAERTVKKQLFIPSPDASTNPTPTSSSTSSTSVVERPIPPPLKAPPLNGSADSDSQLLTEEWQFDVLEDPLNLDVNLTTVNSPSANEDFINGFADFSFSNVPLTEEQAAARRANAGDFTYVPVAMNAMVVGYQFLINGVDVTDLRLAPQTLARIYRGQIASWNNLEVTADQGGCRLSTTNAGSAYPVPGFRTDRSGSNLLFNQWLATTAATLDDSTDPPTWTGDWGPPLNVTDGVSTNIGIDDSKVVGETGAERLADFVELGRPGQSGGENDRLNAPVAGRVGFYDRSLAVERGTDLLSIRNAAGIYVAPTDEALLAAFSAADQQPDGTWLPDFTDPNPAVYPLLLITYAVVPTELTTTFTPEKGQRLVEFLDHVMSDEGQHRAAELGFVPLPATLAAQAAASIARIPTAVPVTTTTTTAPVIESVADGSPSGGFGSSGGFDSSGGFGSSGGFSSGSDFSASSFGDFDSSGGGSFSDDGADGELALDDDSAGDVEGELDGGSPQTRLVAAVVNAPSAVLTVPLMLLAGLIALAAGPALRMRRRSES